MKIRSTIIKRYKDENELHNYGNNDKKFVEIKNGEETQKKEYIESYDFFKQKESENEVEVTTNLKPSQKAKIENNLAHTHVYNVYDEKNNFLGTVNGDTEIINRNDRLPGILSKEIISSKIDGQIDLTNVQDKNLSLDPSASDKENWKDFGEGVGKNALGTLTNSLGVTNSDVNDVIGSFKNAGLGSDGPTPYDESMNKLIDWKSKKFKEFHTFDWKPGQTIPEALLNNSVINFVEDVTPGKYKGKLKEIKDKVIPDPLDYVRKGIRPSKGIFDSRSHEVGDILVQKDEYATSLVQAKDSNAVSLSSNDSNDERFDQWNKTIKETRIINALRNKNSYNKTLGYIYIRPSSNFYKNENNGNNENDKKIGLGNLQIPFEFNPDISEGGNQATYVSETLLNRIGQFQVYTGTNLSQLTINLSYMALAPDELDAEDERGLTKQFSTDAWQYYWTNNRIEEIEYKIRSLVMPDVTSSDYLIKPPLIELHIGNETGAGAETVGDLFKYPIGMFGNNANEDNKYLAVSRTVKGSNVNRYKKYIVTNVAISNFNDDSFVWPSLYGRVWKPGESGSPINHIKTAKDIDSTSTDIGYSGYSRRMGFKASIQCVEVTENFLDIVPDFKAYYNAWTYKGEAANMTSNLVGDVLKSDVETTTDNLSAALNTENGIIGIVNADLDNSFKKAFEYISLYKDMHNAGNATKYLYDQAVGKGEDNNYFYYITDAYAQNRVEGNEKKYKNNSTEDEIDVYKKLDPEISIAYNIPVNIDVEPFYDREDFLKAANEYISEVSLSDKNIYSSNKLKKYIKNIEEKMNENSNLESYYNDSSIKTAEEEKAEEEKIITDELKKYPMISDKTVILSEKECLAIISLLAKNYVSYKNDAKNKYPSDEEIGGMINLIFNKLIFLEKQESISAVENPFVNYKNIFTDGLRKCIDKIHGYSNEIIEKIVKDNAKANSELRPLTPEVISPISELYLGGVLEIRNYIREMERSTDYGEEKGALDIIDIAQLIYNKKEYIYLKERLNQRNRQIIDKIEKIILDSGNNINHYKLLKLLPEDHLEDLLFTYVSTKLSLMDIADYGFSYYKAKDEIKDSILNSILIGSDLKDLKKKEKNVKCAVINGEGKKIDVFKGTEGVENVYEYSSVNYNPKGRNKTVFSIKHINNKIVEVIKKNTENDIERLKKNISNYHNIENEKSVWNITKIFRSTSDLKLISEENAEDIIKILAWNTEKYSELEENLKSLRAYYNPYNIQLEFNKVAGYDEKTQKALGNNKETAASETGENAASEGNNEDSYSYFSKNVDSKDIPDGAIINTLKNLHEGKDYQDNENSLREIAFKDLEKCQTVEELRNINPEFLNYHANPDSDYGEIPYNYRRKLSSLEKRSKLTVAGNSINNFNKLI